VIKIPPPKPTLNEINFSAYNRRNSIPVIPIVEHGEGQHLTGKLNLKSKLDVGTTLEIVKLCNIKGTLYHYDEIDINFRPKRTYVNKRFRKVWKWIKNNSNNNEDIIFPTTIVLLKLTDEDYFVIEGLRRVICLKHSKIKVITAQILTYEKNCRNFIYSGNSLRR